MNKGTKTRRSTKAPTAKQLAARKRFAAAAKARSKAAKAKRARNKTIITKPKRVVVLNPGKPVRRKVRNRYVDLVIRGTAEKTPQGWRVGKKTIPQGKGTVLVSSGYYLDKATGLVFAKRARNADHRDADHPIEVTKHWRQGPPGYLTPWQRAHHAGQKDLFEHGIKPAKKRNPDLTPEQIDKLPFAQRNAISDTTMRARLANWTINAITLNADKTVSISITSEFGTNVKTFDKKGKLKNPARRTKQRNGTLASPAARKLREKFTGIKSRKTEVMNASDGTPRDLAKLGKLVLIITANGKIQPECGKNWLCADTKGKLHITTTADRIIDGPARNFGEVKQVEYEEQKPHLGYPHKTIFFHKMGEESGKRPTLHADGKGGLKFRGGNYHVEREGIVD